AVLLDLERRGAEKLADEVQSKHIRVAAIGVTRAPVELVRAALRHRVHEHAGEVALAHVARREHDPELLHRVQGHDLTTGAAARHALRSRLVEALTLLRAADRDRLMPVVRPGAAG